MYYKIELPYQEDRRSREEMMMEEERREIALKVGSFLTVFKDGTTLRTPSQPEVAADGITSKDVTLDSELGQWARIFLPSPMSMSMSMSHGVGAHAHAPVVLYFHGGGCAFGSPAWDNFHTFCADMAARSGAIWISASYRLAPEHRLPAAFHDSFAALQWLCSQAGCERGSSKVKVGSGGAEPEPWLDSADFSKVFIAGESAGGTIVHHVAMRAFNHNHESESEDRSSLHPLKIQGLIFIHPGFFRWAKTRTQEELDCPQDEFMSWDMADACIQLTLPADYPVDTNPYFNPIPAISGLGPKFGFPPKSLVALADHDALHFFVLEYIKALRNVGHHVEELISHGVGHVFFINQPESEQTHTLKNTIVKFIKQQ